MHAIRAAMPNAPRITNFTKATSYWIGPGAMNFHRVDARAALDAARAEFWPIYLAGLKLWPAVSLFNFSAVKTVEGRAAVGAAAGLVWGVYLSMVVAN